SPRAEILPIVLHHGIGSESSCWNVQDAHSTGTKPAGYSIAEGEDGYRFGSTPRRDPSHHRETPARGGVCLHMCVMTAARRSRRKRKTQRMELRVAPSVRKLIQRATALSGLAAGDLACEGARRILEDHEREVLAAHAIVVD